MLTDLSKAYPAVELLQGHTIENQLALASVIVGGIAILATLYGVWLGARLNLRIVEQQRQRENVDLALAKATLALDAVRIEDLSITLDNLTVPRLRAHLEVLQKEGELAEARNALVIVSATHPSQNVREEADGLSVALSWAYLRSMQWYELKIESRTEATLNNRGQESALALNEAKEAEQRTLEHIDTLRAFSSPRHRSWGHCRHGLGRRHTHRLIGGKRPLRGN